MKDSIKLYWVKTHNLKNIDVEIPKNKITVISWVSGSWKSTLAFWTIYKEWQFRYIESLSTYLRGFFNLWDRPEIDYSEWLSPAIAIEQNKKVWNKRSSVWTITEADDYLRLAFAKLWEIFCYKCWEHIKSKTIDQLIDQIIEKYDWKKIWLLSDLKIFKEDKKIRQYFRANQKKVDKWIWFTQFLVKWKDFNSVYFYLEEPSFNKENLPVDLYGIYDKIIVNKSNKYRLQEDLIKMFSLYDKIYIWEYTEDIQKHIELKSYTIYSYCSKCNIHFPEYTPAHFSPNRAEWACEFCQWTWETLQVDLDRMIDKNQPVKNAILAWRDSNIWQKILKKLSMSYGFNLDVKWKNLDDDIKDIIINWDNQLLRLNMWWNFISLHYNGIEQVIKDQYEKWMLTRDFQAMIDFWVCPKCGGKKLNKFALSVKLKTSSYFDISYFQSLPISKLIKELKKIKVDNEKKELKKMILNPLLDRLETIEDLWLGHLSLLRWVLTLSWWEIQRLQLAKQLWNKLSGIIYVLDEPTIWLDTKETLKTINAIKKLKQIWNTIIIVEHNEDFIKNADYIIEIWPWAWDFGWEIVFSWKKDKFLKNDTLTSNYVTWKKQMKVDFEHKVMKKYLEVKWAKKHNLKDIDVKIPLWWFTVITWSSWAWKTTLLYDIIYNFFANKESIIQWYIRVMLMKKGYSWTDIMSKQLMNPAEYANYEKQAITDFFENKLEVDTIKWYEDIQNYVYVDQSAIGKNPRSCPATFIWVRDDIRNLLSNSNEAKLYGFTDSYFSFNSSKGACQECKWYGYKKIELQFLPDTYVECPLCHGKRFKPEVLNVYWNGKNASDILSLYIKDALVFFEDIPNIKEKLQLLVDIWLWYLKLWQPAHTLSWGESQRLKLVKHLLKKYRWHTIYFLDEPTVWLHFVDIEKLLNILKKFLNKQDTIVMIEHDKNLLKFADKVIDLEDGKIKQ